MPHHLAAWSFSARSCCMFAASVEYCLFHHAACCLLNCYRNLLEIGLCLIAKHSPKEVCHDKLTSNSSATQGRGGKAGWGGLLPPRKRYAASVAFAFAAAFAGTGADAGAPCSRSTAAAAAAVALAVAACTLLAERTPDLCPPLRLMRRPLRHCGSMATLDGIAATRGVAYKPVFDDFIEPTDEFIESIMCLVVLDIGSAASIAAG